MSNHRSAAYSFLKNPDPDSFIITTGNKGILIYLLYTTDTRIMAPQSFDAVTTIPVPYFNRLVIAAANQKPLSNLT